MTTLDLAPIGHLDSYAGGRIRPRRLAQIMLGLVLITAGVIMLVTPGSGIVAIMVGLNLVKPNNVIVRWMRRKIPGVSEDGALPRRYLALGAGFLVASMSISVLYGSTIMVALRGLALS